MNTNDTIDHHDEAQEEILFPSDAEAGIDLRDDPMEENEALMPDDFSDDAEALASAGHGMDEDYGGISEREDWDEPVEVDYDRE